MPDDIMRLEGAVELRRALRAVDETARGPLLRKAVYQGAVIVRDKARQLAPRRYGKLRKSIRATRRRAKPLIGAARVRVGVPYGHLVEFGHRIVARRSQQGAGGAVVGHVPPYPYLRPAFDVTKERAAEATMDALWDGVRATWERT